MKNKKTCLSILIFAALAFAAIMLFGVFLRNAQQRVKDDNIPPSVIVYSPSPSESIQAGDIIPAYVVATSQNPITHLEFWLDGVLLEIRVPDTTLGEATTFSASTELQLEAGQHIFSARVVDNQGLVGQSLPIPVEAKAGPTVVITGDGQTIDEIAALTDTDAGLLHEANPSLGNDTLPSGAGVLVPAPGAGKPSGNPPSAPPPPAPNGTPMLEIKLADPIPDIGQLLPILLSALPKAPTSLQAGYEDCTVRLVWTDNADNETSFNVWMQALGGPPRVIATLTGSPNTGQAWYEFKSPQVGFYSFWVEAVNGLGTQSSEIAWVGVNDLQCDAELASHLEIETLYMYVQGSYDRVYCYLSVEGAPEKRIPIDSNLFIPVSGNWGDLSNWTGSGAGSGGNSVLLPEPTDSNVSLETTCLGWNGGDGPYDLGKAVASASKETWNGGTQELQNAGYSIGYRIQPHGSWSANGTFTYSDFTLPMPYDLNVTVKTSSSPLERDQFARTPILSWGWHGNFTQITGYTVFLNGTPIKTVPNNASFGNTIAVGRTDALITLPTSCGGTYVFEVAANSGQAMSDLATYAYHQAPCAQYAEVKFETITFGCLDDGDVPVIPFIPTDCSTGGGYRNDTIEAYYWIAVHGEKISIWAGDMTIQIDYSFHELGAKSPQKNSYASFDTFLVPIDPLNPSIWFGLNMKDKDPWYDADDHICDISQDVIMPYADWKTYDHEFKLECQSRDGYAWVTVRVHGVESADEMRSANPGIGQPVGP